MLTMTDVAANDQELERNRRCVIAMRQLAQLGIKNCTMVYHAWTKEEADWPSMTVIYLAAGVRPKTALIKDNAVVVMDGWDAPEV